MDNDSFWLNFSRLNALCGQSWRWEARKARQDHKDEFGKLIEPGEEYFAKNYGSGFGDVVKVSRASMEAMLLCVMVPGGIAEAMGDKLLAEEMERMHQAVNSAFSNTMRTADTSAS